jgi:hypothetical protein
MLDHKPLPYSYAPKYLVLTLILKLILLGMLYFHPMLKVMNNWVILIFGFILGMPVGFLTTLQIEHYWRTETNPWGRSKVTIIKQIYIGLLWLATFLVMYFVIYMPELITIPLYGLVLLLLLAYIGYLLAKDVILLVWFSIK